ncbi:hypothetical protein Pmani_005105 [Petrolisthes manimaculis]|uniref:Uncharacterized protein n=1 Tax=Petrolisthes manimaculis TaxID=1843537 RepID=A0AAE1QDI1_9EUCA|nr:hypothetical protein Pmani_005105 [Petrolisthes manimaculis]
MRLLLKGADTPPRASVSCQFALGHTASGQTVRGPAVSLVNHGDGEVCMLSDEVGTRWVNFEVVDDEECGVVRAGDTVTVTVRLRRRTMIKAFRNCIMKTTPYPRENKKDNGSVDIALKIS